MRHTRKQICIGLFLVGLLSGNIFAQSRIESEQALTAQQQSIISIAAITAKDKRIIHHS